MTVALIRFLNVAIRGLTLVSKFLLVYLLAKYLPPEQLGLYGLIVATIGLAIYPLGLDFYIFTTRELIKENRSRWGGLLKSQIVLHVVLYILILPLLSIIFALELLPWHVAFWFFLILVLEHLGQEMMRLLIASSQQLAASLVLFFRSGAWALVLAILMVDSVYYRQLEVVLAAWMGGGVIAVLVGVGCIARLDIRGWQENVRWLWLYKGLKIAIPFLIATFALRGLFTVDRYLMEALQGLESLAVYVLFIGIGNALLSIMDAGIFSFSYPKLIAARHQGDLRAFKHEFVKLSSHTIIMAVVFSLIAMLAINPILESLDNPIYLNQASMFPWVLLASVLYIVSMVPHYGLYAKGLDKSVIISHLSAFMLFTPIVWVLSLWQPLFAVPQGLAVVFSLMTLLKGLALYNSRMRSPV